MLKTNAWLSHAYSFWGPQNMLPAHLQTAFHFLPVTKKKEIHIADRSPEDSTQTSNVRRAHIIAYKEPHHRINKIQQ